MDIFSLFNLSKTDDKCVTFEATVTTGFESVAALEILNTLGHHLNICKSRGRVFFNAPAESVSQVLLLRGIDNLYAITYAEKNETLSKENREEIIETLKNLCLTVDWNKSLSVWKEVSKFQGNCFPCREDYFHALEEEAAIKDEVKKEILKLNIEKCKDDNVMSCDSNSCQDGIELMKSKVCENFQKSNNSKSLIRKLYQEKDMRNPQDKILKYRTTCNRTGQHVISSIEGAWYFGGQLQDHFNWIVDLVNYDLEVTLNIKDEEVYFGVALTEESLHKRNIMYFGPTTLRATVCHNLLRLAESKPGDIVMDPLCGGGSIPIEGAISFPATYQLCGDIHTKAVNRAWANLHHIKSQKKGNIDLVMWDVCCLPLQDASVDVFVTDLPFGKRSGSKFNNQVLYQKALLEVARTTRSSGRAVCLTWDKKNLTRTVYHLHELWTLVRIVGVNIGGLAAAAYVLKRSCQSIYNYFENSKEKRKKKHRS